jgi:glycosyltransferase involved in cell wall biosynthesis
LRVLFISFFDPFMAETGPAIHLRGLSVALNMLGCEVHVLVLNTKNRNRVVNGVKIHYFNPAFNPIPKIPGVSDYALPLVSFKEVDKLCKEYKIDIVHGQSPSSYGYGLLRRGSIPFVVTLHSTSFGEINSYFGIPLSFVNRNVVFGVVGDMLMGFLTRVEYKCADKVIAVSRALAEDAIRFFRLPRERVVTIHNGIDLQNLADPQVKEEIKEHMILSVGRLVWRKGYKYLIDAMRQVLLEYPDAKLFIVGYGEQGISLQRHVKKLGISNSVHFLGKVSREKLYSLYQAAEVYVQPSLYEPFGITILEAMSMRKPVIATHVGGIQEIIKNGIEGLLVEPRNSLQLANAIMRVFSDSALRRRLGSDARKRVERDFTWEAIAKKTLELYKNLL